MNQLAILPTGSRDELGEEQPVDTTLDYEDGQKATFMFRRVDGKWAVSPFPSDGSAKGSADDHGAMLCYQPIEGGAEWFVLDPHGRFSVNDQPGFGIQRIAPGDLICHGDQSWFVTQRITPEPIEAPESVRDKLCPMCGDKLGAAPVVACSCGRFLHLQRPEVPEDESALNCFLVAKTCGNCGLPATLQPQLVPEPPPSLRPYDDSHELDSEDF